MSLTTMPRLLFGFLFLLATTHATAQTPLLEIDYQNATIFHVLSNGQLIMPIGAQNGYVLTTDADGNATWMAPTGGLTLPFAGIANTTGAAFSVENTHASGDGLVVSSAGRDGLVVQAAGNPSTSNSNALKSGLEVHGAEGYGLYIGRADNTGIQVQSAGADGVQVLNAADDGMLVFQAGSPSGLLSSPEKNGVEVVGAEGHGFYVGQADEDGVHVHAAGSPSQMHDPNANNGFEVNGAEGYGLYVGHADNDGVYVRTTNSTGVSVGIAGNPSVSPGFGTTGPSDGFSVNGAERYGLRIGHADAGGVDVGTVGDPDMGFNTNTEKAFSVRGVGGYGLWVGHADVHGVHVVSAGQLAGFFGGDVEITGSLTKGSGTFKIDHPLDPENRYLSHSFVESPDMMNIYNGNTTTDHQGVAEVELPAYFEALNRDFRYQLTVIGTFAQAIVAEKIQNGRFVIRTDQPNVEVSWQITGIRQDPYAERNRVVVETDKPLEEQGYYLHPEAYGQPKERGIGHIDAVAHRPDEDERPSN